MSEGCWFWIKRVKKSEHGSDQRGWQTSGRVRKFSDPKFTLQPHSLWGLPNFLYAPVLLRGADPSEIKLFHSHGNTQRWDQAWHPPRVQHRETSL